MEVLSCVVPGTTKPTNLLVQQYADRVLVIVSQTNKIGALIQASLPESIALPVSSPANATEPPPGIELVQLFGSAPTDDVHQLYNIYASHIATTIWIHETRHGVQSRRPVIAGLTLFGNQDPSDNRVTFAAVMESLATLLEENRNKS